MYAFGKVMRRLMVEYDTSQAEISRATGINKQNLTIASRRRACPTAQLGFLAALAALVGPVSPIWDAAGTQRSGPPPRWGRAAFRLCMSARR